MTKRNIVREYYIRLDSGRNDLLELFSEDAQFYFPKFGIARGKSSFEELISELLISVESIEHDIDNFIYISEGPYVVVEGTTSGRMRNGQRWSGGQTPGGRFSSIFEVKNDLITRMHVYLDPDYTGRDTTRFLRNNTSRISW